MSINNLYNTLGLCYRANKVVSGETLMSQIRSRRVYLVIVAEDASSRTKKQYTTKCAYYDIPIFIIGDSVSLSKAIGKVNRVAVGISDKGLSEVLIKKVKENEVTKTYE